MTWSVLDHERRPKLGYAALTAARAEVIVVADRPAPAYRPRDPLSLDVHVVSDRRRAVEAVTVTARLAWAGDEHRMSWEGDVPADACVRVGTIQAVVPPAPGPLTVELDLAGDDVRATTATRPASPPEQADDSQPASGSLFRRAHRLRSGKSPPSSTSGHNPPRKALDACPPPEDCYSPTGA